MKKRESFLLLATVSFSALVAAGISGCTTDDLCRDCGGSGYAGRVHVDVVFDWKNDPGANPEGMRVAFHRLDAPGGNGVVRYDLPGSKGGPVSVSPGRYALLAYNNDADGISFGNLDYWNLATVRTQDAKVTDPMAGGRTRASGSDFRPVADEPVRACPDRMWADAAAETDVTGEGQTIPFEPSPLFAEYDYTIRNVKNLSSVKYMSAAITGMADGVSLKDNSLSGQRCTHAVPALRKDSTTVTGSFRVFGHNRADSTRHFMELYVITKSGKQIRLHGDPGTVWDVTRQVENALDPRHVSILIDGVTIPQDSAASGGFLPGFENWDDVHVVVPV